MLFEGARGSGEHGPGTAGWKPGTSDPKGLGKELNDALSQIEQKTGSLRSFQIESVNYPATSVRALVGLHLSTYFKGLAEGVQRMLGELQTWAKACPFQQIVLAGYSQGAMLVHRVLLDLVQSKAGRSILARVTSAILIGDGDQLPSDHETKYGSAGSLATGIGQDFPTFSHSPAKKFPSSLESKVIRVCNRLDIVCDYFNVFSVPTGIRTHLHYTGSKPLGQAATQAAKNLFPGRKVPKASWAANYTLAAWAHDATGNAYKTGSGDDWLAPSGNFLIYSPDCAPPSCFSVGTAALNTDRNSGVNDATAFELGQTFSANGSYSGTYGCHILNQAGKTIWTAKSPAWIENPDCGPLGVSNTGNRLVYYVQGQNVNDPSDTFTWLFEQGQHDASPTELTDISNPWSFDASMSADGNQIVWEDACVGGCDPGPVPEYLNISTKTRKSLTTNDELVPRISDDGATIMLSDFFGDNVTLINTTSWSQRVLTNVNLAGLSANLKYFITYKGDFGCPTGYKRYDVASGKSEVIISASNCHSLGVIGQQVPTISDSGDIIAIESDRDLAPRDSNDKADVYILHRTGPPS